MAEMSNKMHACRKFFGSFILDKREIKKGEPFYKGDGKRIGKLLLEDFGRLYRSDDIRQAQIELKGAAGAMINNMVTINYPHLGIGEDITAYFKQRVIINYALEKGIISDEWNTIYREILKNFVIMYDEETEHVGLRPRKKANKEAILLDRLLDKEVKDGYRNEMIGDKDRGFGYTHILRRNQQLKLQTWQKELLFNWNKYNFIAGSRRAGKSTYENEYIMLRDGTQKLAKDLELTDALMGSDYKPTRIIGLEKGNTKKCYRITLDNGMSKVVTYDHRLPLDINFNGKWDVNTDKEYYLTAEELFNNPRDVMIPVAMNYGIEEELYTEEEMMIYGYFLGDGVHGTNIIVGNHDRILGKCGAYEMEYKKGASYYKVPGFKRKVDLEGYDELAKNKFIDERIFKSKYKWKVVEGLLNTDGYIAKKLSGNKDGYNRKGSGIIEYCSVSEKLVDGLQRLLYQLGVICYKRTKKIRSNFNSSNEVAYYLYISHKESLQLILNNVDLTTKKNYKEFKEIVDSEGYVNSSIGLLPKTAKITNTSRKSKKPWYHFQRNKIDRFDGLEEYLKYSWHKFKIELVGEEKIVSVKVDAEDELYFCNTILSHNTYTSSYIAYREIWRSSRGFGGRPRQTLYVCISETKMFQPMQYLLNICKKDIESGFIKYNVKDKLFENLITGSKLRFITSNAKGGAASYGADLVIIDEAAMVSDQFWEDLLPIIVQEGSDVYAISTINEDLDQNWFYKKLLEGELQLNPKIQSMRVTIDDNELLTEETREEMKKELYHNQIKYWTQLYSIFPNGSTVFQLDGVVQPSQENKANNVIIGYDPGKIVDTAACIIIDIDTLRVVREVEWKNVSYHEQRRLLTELKAEYEAHVVMDRTGVGEGVKEIMGDIVDCSFRYKGNGDLNYNNTHNYYTVSKGDLVETLQLYFMQYGLKIDSGCISLINELRNFKKLTSNGKIIQYGGVGSHDDLVNRLMLASYYLFHIIQVKEKGVLKKDQEQFNIEDWFEDEFNIEKRFNNYIY